MTPPIQAKRYEFFAARRLPVRSPSFIETKWITVVSIRRIKMGQGIVPVHRPAEILSTERANAKSAASLPERTALSVWLTFSEMVPVVRLPFFL